MTLVICSLNKICKAAERGNCKYSHTVEISHLPIIERFNCGASYINPGEHNYLFQAYAALFEYSDEIQNSFITHEDIKNLSLEEIRTKFMGHFLIETPSNIRDLYSGQEKTNFQNQLKDLSKKQIQEMKSVAENKISFALPLQMRRNIHGEVMEVPANPREVRRRRGIDDEIF